MIIRNELPSGATVVMDAKSDGQFHFLVRS
jgi:hypothetical protein